MKELSLLEWISEECERQALEAEQKIKGEVSESYYNEMKGYIRGLNRIKDISIVYIRHKLKKEGNLPDWLE